MGRRWQDKYRSNSRGEKTLGIIDWWPKPIRSILSKRPTIILREPVVKTLRLDPMLSPTVLEYDRELERLRDEKKREWLARGYPEKLVNMALELAENYADEYSRWVVRAIEAPELRRKAYISLYKYALDEVAEKWIRTMAV